MENLNKTHWDCAKLLAALSEMFALADGDGGVDGRVERDVAAWLTIMADSSESCLLSPLADSSEGI